MKKIRIFDISILLTYLYLIMLMNNFNRIIIHELLEVVQLDTLVHHMTIQYFEAN